MKVLSFLLEGVLSSFEKVIKSLEFLILIIFYIWRYTLLRGPIVRHPLCLIEFAFDIWSFNSFYLYKWWVHPNFILLWYWAHPQWIFLFLTELWTLNPLTCLFICLFLWFLLLRFRSLIWTRAASPRTLICFSFASTLRGTSVIPITTAIFRRFSLFLWFLRLSVETTKFPFNFSLLFSPFICIGHLLHQDIIFCLENLLETIKTLKKGDPRRIRLLLHLSHSSSTTSTIKLRSKIQVLKLLATFWH